MINTLNIRRHLSKGQKKMIKRLLRVFLSLVPSKSNLQILALKHGTDKISHGYIEHYEKILSGIRKRKMNILEIGVGGYNDPKSGGNSLRMWQEYFPNSMIYSIDIYDKSELQDNRIKIFQGSQNDKDFLNNISKSIGLYDLIIDDGSHENEHIITSFNVLFPYLKDEGFYIIEDLHTSYDPNFGGDSIDLNNLNCAWALLKSLTDGLNFQYISKWTPSFICEHIVSMFFFPQIVFIKKGRNKQQIII